MCVLSPFAVVMRIVFLKLIWWSFNSWLKSSRSISGSTPRITAFQSWVMYLGVAVVLFCLFRTYDAPAPNLSVWMEFMNVCTMFLFENSNVVVSYLCEKNCLEGTWILYCWRRALIYIGFPGFISWFTIFTVFSDGFCCEFVFPEKAYCYWLLGTLLHSLLQNTPPNTILQDVKDLTLT